MRAPLLLAGLLSTSLFAQLAPRQPATLYQHMMEVNKEWRTMDPMPSGGDRLVHFRSDADRIAMHLHLVREILEERTPEGLSGDQMTARMELLRDLDAYADRGLFPQNDFLPCRNPVFIDRHQTACAVGQLMIESGNASLAERISREMNLAYVHDMQRPEIGLWAQEHGFTADELAWIQPGYLPVIPWYGLGDGTDGTVTALFNRGNGDLIVAGEFTMAGTTPATQVAEWNGSSYQALGGGVSGYITCGLEFNGLLYLGGSFNFGYSDLAVWDGTSWTYQNAFSGKYVQVNDLHVFNGELYAAGFAAGFAGDTHQVLRLEAGSWLPVGGPLGTAFNDMVLALDEVGGDLVCAGRFTQLGMFGGPSLAHVAYVYGSSDWSQLGDGLDATVRDLHSFDGMLYACGDLRVDSAATFGLARISPGAITWEQLMPSQLTYIDYFNDDAYLSSMTTAGSELFVGGAFNYSGLMTYGANVAMFMGAADAFAPYAYPDGRVNKLGSFSNLLVMGGEFASNNGLSAPHVAYTELSTGIPEPVAGQAIDLLPNPAQDEVTVVLQRSPTLGTIAEVVDAAGRNVISAMPFVTRDLKIDVRALSPGNYVVRVSNRSGVRSMVFVKQ